MNLKAIIYYLGHLMLIEGISMIPALLIALYMQETSSIKAFIITICLLLIIGFIIVKTLKKGTSIHIKEGFVIVSLGWIVISLFGGLPFFISGVIPSFVDCFFETVSGFTTTGSSILTNIEATPYGLLYWRSFTHWLGGMGVLVFMLAIIPSSKGNGETFYLLKAESPGPIAGKFTPTIKNSTRILYIMYIVLTIIQIILLLLGGMPLFDSVTITFGTAGTGGFAIKNTSIAYYESGYLQFIIGLFMMLFGINFSAYYLILMKQFKAAFKCEEVRLYLGIILFCTVSIFFNILPMYTNGWKALLDSFFQVSSIITTTGYATANFDLWPELSRYILVAIMLFGACAGSTGGGIKISRILIMFKYIKNEMMKMLKPNAVRHITLDGKTLDDSTISGVNAYLMAYFFICIISLFIVSMDNFNQETNVSAVISCLNNIGPGINMVGPMGNFAHFSDISKIVLSFDMLLGRLEIFPVFFLFSPSVWRSKYKNKK